MRDRHLAALVKLRDREVALRALSRERAGVAWERARLEWMEAGAQVRAVHEEATRWMADMAMARLIAEEEAEAAKPKMDEAHREGVRGESVAGSRRKGKKKPPKSRGGGGDGGGANGAVAGESTAWAASSSQDVSPLSATVVAAADVAEGRGEAAVEERGGDAAVTGGVVGAQAPSK